MSTSPVTVSVAFVHGIFSGVRAHGGSLEHYLHEAGIPPDLLNQPAARVTAEQYLELFRLVMNNNNDEGCGFFSRPLRQGSFMLVMRNALTANTVESALRRLLWGFQLLQDDVQFVLARDDELTALQIVGAPVQTARQIAMHELLLRVLSRMTIWLHNGRGRIRPFGFDFGYTPPQQADEYHNLFRGRLRFAQSHSALWFQNAHLSAPLRRDDAALHEFIANSPRNLVIPRRHDEATTEKVRTYLQQVRPQWPDLAQTATALHVSVSTLQRHLANEHSSFQSVKDQLRRDLAIVRLNTSTTPLAIVAAELGFSDQAVFQRAFKTWTGSAPGAYRQLRDLDAP